MQAQVRGGSVLKGIRWFWVAAVAALILDLVSKGAVFHLLGGPPPDRIYQNQHVLWLLPGAFRLICHYNTGGAFGWAAGNILLFLAAAAVLIPGLVLTAYYCRDPRAPLWALGLIVGGAVGNLYDRLLYPGVRDFFEVLNPKTGKGLWPVFNVADIAIVVGVGVYLLWTLFDSARRKEPADGAEAEKESAV